MLLDNDFDIKKNVQEYVNSMKLLRRGIKAYVGWVRQNQQRGIWSFSILLDELHFEANNDYFVVSLSDDLRKIVDDRFKYQMLNLGYNKANKNANNTYTDIIFNLVKEYIEKHNLNIRDYKIRYKNL